MQNRLLNLAAIMALVSPCSAVIIEVDYTYDSNNYFAGNAQATAALEAAADRWSRVLADNNLGQAQINDTNDGRIGFINPGTGASYEISGATNSASDGLVSIGAAAASEYRTIDFAQDRWLLFAGGRALSSVGTGGTGTGTNFTSVFSDANSHLNRGFGGFSSASGFSNLPTWGGSVAFDTGTTFSFDGDFYTVALHEIGHALGLSVSFDNFDQFVTGTSYDGVNAVEAFNADNGASVTSLEIVGGGNTHWEDNGTGAPTANQSLIFEPGDPDFTGTVGQGNLQDLLMEPVENFSPTVRRIELTNVDVGAAEDIGWIVVPEPSASLLTLLGLLCLAVRRRRPF